MEKLRKILFAFPINGVLKVTCVLSLGSFLACAMPWQPNPPMLFDVIMTGLAYSTFMAIAFWIPWRDD